MKTVVTESNHGGGLHGRLTTVLKQKFLDAVKEELVNQERSELAENLRYNDLITLSGGTSFGALSTVALSAVGGENPYFSSPAEFGEFIDQEASNIFPHRSNVLGKLFNNPRQLLGGLFGTTRFNAKPLRELLVEIVGKDTRMSDIEDNVMLTMTQMSPEIDVRFAKSHLARGQGTQFQEASEAQRHDWLVWQAALGSASPTTFLPGVTLENPHRSDEIVVVDGGQSGFNNPTLPVLAEIAFMCGEKTDRKEDAYVMQAVGGDLMLTMPHRIIHLDWGTGIYPNEIDPGDARKNTFASLGSNVVTASLRTVSNFSLKQGERAIDDFYSFDIDARELPDDIRPDSNFVLSTDEQLGRLRDSGEFAAERLSDEIHEAAKLVAEAYIERVDYEAEHPGKSYIMNDDFGIS